MFFSRLLQHPFSLFIVTLFLAVAPSFFIPFSYLYRHFSLLSQSLIVLGKSLFFMLAMPMAIIAFVLDKPLSAFGWLVPKNRKEVGKAIVLASLVFIPIILLFSTYESFRGRYSLYGASIPYFLLNAGLFASLYYLAEGFLFFGFLFFGFWPRLRYHSFWIVSILFTLLHVTKPGPEIAFSFFSSLIFCYLSLKTKSVFPAAIVHVVIAFILNVLVTFVP